MDAMSYAGPNASYTELMLKGDGLAHTKPSTAASYYERALAMKPENPEPLIKKTRLHYRHRGNDDEDDSQTDPIDDANRLVDLFPKDARSYAERGRILAENNLHTDAIKDLEHAIHLDPDFVDAYILCGESYLALDKYRKAANRYMRAVRLSPDNSEAAYCLCYSFEKLKMYRRALAVLKSYLPYDKGFNFEVYRHLGRVYGHLGQMKKSYKCYMRSVQMRYPSADMISTVLKHYREITATQKEIKTFDPLDIESFHIMGMIHTAAYWTSTGINMLETSLCFEPHAWVCEFIAVKHMDRSNYLEAISYFERALKFEVPYDTESIYTNLIICTFTCGLHADTLSYVKKAKSLGISNPHIMKYRKYLKNMKKKPKNEDMVLHGHTRKFV